MEYDIIVIRDTMNLPVTEGRYPCSCIRDCKSGSSKERGPEDQKEVQRRHEQI